MSDEIESTNPVDLMSTQAQEITDLRFVTKWAMVVEGIDEEGNRSLYTIDSGIEFWERMGMLEYAYLLDKAIVKKMVSGQ